MLGFIGETIQGGWNAVGNIISGIGTGIGDFTSSFFPQPQAKILTSQITQPAGGTGQTYRPTIKENQSMLETMDMAANNWLDSMYEAQFAPAATGYDTQTRTWTDNLADFFGGAKSVLGQAREIRTLVDEVAYDWGLSDRRPISAGPQEVGNSPGNVIYQNRSEDDRASVIEIGKGILSGVGSMLSGFADQVKGLFSLGYESPTGAQPVFSIKHEVEPTAKLSTGLIIGAVALGAILLFGRKK